MTKNEPKVVYTLNCDTCGETYKSGHGFSAPQVCPECSRIKAKKLDKEELIEATAKLILWQHSADGYDLDEIEKCWDDAGEPTHDAYLRWAKQLLSLFAQYEEGIREEERERIVKLLESEDANNYTGVLDGSNYIIIKIRPKVWQVLKPNNQ